MAKVKNRKRVSVDQIQKKRQNRNTKKALNPFEIHINKEKMRVLGQQRDKDRGVPGISRAKAIAKRKRTLLPEYRLQHKSNKFMDKRIGEKNKMSNEDKATVRYAAVKATGHSKQNPFDLSGDLLSHRDHTLSEIEKFEDIRSDDESEEENEAGRLDSEFVEAAHFGNGILKNTGREGVKTHKQLIEQLILESKKRKIEQQKMKEATMELTEKLDTEWKDLQQLVSSNFKKKEDKEGEKPKPDDYDKFFHELKFAAKGIVSDRLKTEDEIAKEEKEQLEKLEQERLERMRGFVDDITKVKTHRSADDLDDDFVYESDKEENMLSYDQEGQSNIQIKAELNGKVVGENENCSEDDGEVAEEEQEEEEEEVSDSEDSLADLKEDQNSEESEIESIENESIKDQQEKTGKFTENQQMNDDNSRKKAKPDPKSGISKFEKRELEKASNDLPFTFDLPQSYNDLLDMFKNRSHYYQRIILERMIKCNHPSLGQGNKEKLDDLFDFLLQYLNDLFSDIDDVQKLKESFQIFNSLMPHIYDLAKMNPEHTHNSVLEVIKEKQQEYRKRKRKQPGIEVLVFLKLVSLLFSTSDFRHQIVTPCFVFMEQILNSCSVKTPGDMCYGLFLCALILEYTSLSKRYLPVAVNFLSGILHMAIPKTSVRVIKVLPPFKSLASDLVLTRDSSKLKTNNKLSISYLIQQQITEEFKVSILYTTQKLLKEFMDAFTDLSSNVEIFQEVEKYLQLIPLNLYPEEVKNEHKSNCDSLAKLKSERKLYYLLLEKKRPKALRLYEPKIEKVYEKKYSKVQSRKNTEKDRLLQKLKKETKGALREVRRDTAFLGRVKINQRIESDKDRKDKVKRIYAEAAMQQSELNALDRKKKKK